MKKELIEQLFVSFEGIKQEQAGVDHFVDVSSMIEAGKGAGRERYQHE